MGASATDIITYIGVPLAVIGVLPIIAVVLKTIAFSLRVRSQLQENLGVVGLHQTPLWPFKPHKETIVDANSKLLPGKRYFQDISYYSIDVDALQGQITLSFPVLVLRVPPTGHELYVNMRPEQQKSHPSRSCRSKLKGGTWTILYFSVEVMTPESLQKNPPGYDIHPEVGNRNYVLKPTDQVCQRPALINFASLVEYLMDLGAVPEVAGWTDLSQRELQVSRGTVLLTKRGATRREFGHTTALPVLVIRKQEEQEDDRLLSVLLKWEGVDKMIAQAMSRQDVSRIDEIVIKDCLQPRIPRDLDLPQPQDAEADEESDSEPHDFAIIEDRTIQAPDGRTCHVSELKFDEELIAGFELDLEPLEEEWGNIIEGPRPSYPSSMTASAYAKAKMRPKKLVRQLPKSVEYSSGVCLAAFESRNNSNRSARRDYFRVQPTRFAPWLNIVAVALSPYQVMHSSYIIPHEVVDFARNSFRSHRTIPCGVLQSCGLVTAEACAPGWAPEDARAIAFQPDAQGMIKRSNLQGPTVNGIPVNISERVHQNRIPHALSSYRWPVEMMARNLRSRLLDQYDVPTPPELNANPTTIRDWHRKIAEMILYRLILRPEEAPDVGEVLRRWQHVWYENDLGPDDVTWIADHKTPFMLATYLLCAVGEYACSEDFEKGLPMERVQNCLAKWELVVIY